MRLTDSTYERVYRRFSDIALDLGDLYYGSTGQYVLIIWLVDFWGCWDWVEDIVTSMLQSEHIPASVERGDDCMLFWMG